MMRALAGSGSAHSFLTTAVSTAFSETAADRRQARMGRSRLPRGGQRGPRPGDVERQVGGVLRFLAGRDRLHRIEAQIPTRAAKSMSPSSCVSSEGWHVQQEKGLPGQESEAP